MYSMVIRVNNTKIWSAWVAHWVERLALGFGSGHDLTVHGFKSCEGLCTDSKELAWDSLSVCLSLSLPLPCLCFLSLSQNKHFKK